MSEMVLTLDADACKALGRCYAILRRLAQEHREREAKERISPAAHRAAGDGGNGHPGGQGIAPNSPKLERRGGAPGDGTQGVPE